MSEGFKKHFNASTMNGRANVAKVTYATMALLYIVYRMRRGSGKKPKDGSGMLADGSCSCDQKSPPEGHDSDTGFYETDPSCGSCRERSERAMSEYDREQQRRSAAKARQDHSDECRAEPPSPPSSSSPPGSGGVATPRRKCPCENPHRKSIYDMKSSRNDTRSFMQRQHQHDAQDADDVRPASEIVGQVGGAVYRVLSGVFNAVMGGESSVTSTTSPPKSQRNQEERRADQADHTQNEDGEVTAVGYEPMDCECGLNTPLKPRTGPRCCESPTGANEGQAQPEDAQYNDSYNDGYASVF
ncbi:uncharacterized protein [Drosophila pseudoobscura]|uniref:Uncharacterized protein n=1 Tax=Drosophila pseudoobscura pseudoobscura TaxID=46245 RepID=A0A6I8VHL4_DROPS|nr:uncharacterized protein LOC26532514 [Drosophila pseudoobscura]